MLEDMRGKGAVLSSAARNDAVIVSLLTPETVTKRPQLLFPFLPIDKGVFGLGKLTRCANTVFVEGDRSLRRVCSIFVFYGTGRSLVRNYAFLAVMNFGGETVVCLVGFHISKITG